MEGGCQSVIGPIISCSFLVLWFSHTSTLLSSLLCRYAASSCCSFSVAMDSTAATAVTAAMDSTTAAADGGVLGTCIPIASMRVTQTLTRASHPYVNATSHPNVDAANNAANNGGVIQTLTRSRNNCTSHQDG